MGLFLIILIITYIIFIAIKLCLEEYVDGDYKGKIKNTILFISLFIIITLFINSFSHKHNWYYSASKTTNSDYMVYACYECEETSIKTFFSENDDSVNEITVYITDTGEKYHSSGCQYISSSKHSISLEDAINDGYTPCSRCNPPTE